MNQVAGVFSKLGIKDKELLDMIIGYIKTITNAKKAYHNQEVGHLKKQHGETQEKLDRLVDLRLEGEISKDEFEAQKRRLRDKQYEIGQLITTYDKADDQFSKSLISLLMIASDSDKLWASSTISKKRELLNLVFANLQLKGATLCYTLRKPFNDMLKLSNCNNWRGIVDAMRTCRKTYEIVILMYLRSSYFRKCLIKKCFKF